MKSWLKSTVVALVAGSALVIVPTAHAVNGWQVLAWQDIQKLAPAGASALGRTYSLGQIQKTCRLLDGGVTASNIVEGAYLVAIQAGANQQQKQDMLKYGIGIILVAVKRVCPNYLSTIRVAINR